MLLAFSLAAGGDPGRDLDAWEALLSDPSASVMLGGSSAMYSFACVLAGVPERVDPTVSKAFLQCTPAMFEMWSPALFALRGVADIASGRVEAGLARLEAVSVVATGTTHWKYFVLTLVATGRLLTGSFATAVPDALRALRESYESSMHWSLTFAVEVGALLAAALGEAQLAVDAIHSIEAELAVFGGRPSSSWPSTLLRSLRQELWAQGDLGTIEPVRATVDEIAVRLLHTLGEPA